MRRAPHTLNLSGQEGLIGKTTDAMRRLRQHGGCTRAVLAFHTLNPAPEHLRCWVQGVGPGTNRICYRRCYLGGEEGLLDKPIDGMVPPSLTVGSKIPQFLLPLICTAARRNPATCGANPGPRKRTICSDSGGWWTHPSRCRANMAHIRPSRPDSGLLAALGRRLAGAVPNR